MLRIWGRITSLNVKKAVWCVEELGLPYERIDAGLAFGVVDTPEYRKLNPNGLVPVIEDGDFVLWESNSIVRYLSEKHGLGSLCPADLQKRADASRWMDWQLSRLSPAMTPVFQNLVRKSPEERDNAAVETGRLATEPLVAMLDAHLAQRTWLTGDSFTMADIIIGPPVHNWFNLPIERIDRPHLRRWYDSLLARPGSRKVLTLPLL